MCVLALEYKIINNCSKFWVVKHVCYYSTVLSNMELEQISNNIKNNDDGNNTNDNENDDNEQGYDENNDVTECCPQYTFCLMIVLTF
jgi:hypothetical protein